ncbi:MAG TPA: DNA polymerase I, partial [Bacteroidales bacterium]|nr:DNA polymerase I [Bacteroidales bacterium]
ILIAHYVIQPEKRHQLKVLAENYLEYSMITIDKKEITTTLPKQTLTDIAGERIAVFKKLHPILADELEKTNTVTLFSNIEIPLAEVLASMEFHGITFDTNVLAENEKELSEEISKLEKEIFELAGKEFNITSPKQLGEVLFEDLQIIKNAKLTKTKQYQTGEEVLSKLVDKHPIVRLILEYRSLTKLKSTYIDALPLLVNPKTKKIHTTFNQTVTSTGRLSSVNPNLQNIPIRTQRGKEVRKAFVASDKDWVILSADYSQIELRIIASISGDENMITSFNNDEDIHAVTASHIYNIPVGQVTDEMRRQAKTVNFGIIYGISAFGLADRLRVPQRVAIDLINEYYRSFPALSSYLSKTIEFAKENGYVETLLGRRRYIREINSQNAVVRKASERNAINAPIQGSAADLIKIAMINIYRRLKEENMKTRMLLQVHDELVFEVPKEEIEKATSLIRSTMVGAISLRVPLKVDINFGKSWYDAH